MPNQKAKTTTSSVTKETMPKQYPINTAVTTSKKTVTVTRQEAINVSTTTKNKALPRKDISLGAIPKKKADHTTSLTNMEAMPTINKGSATIFPTKKTVPRQEDINATTVSSDEELFRAAEALENVITLSDEELMEAVTEIETNQATGSHSPDQMLSLKMMSIHLERKPGQMGGIVDMIEDGEKVQGLLHHAQEDGQGAAGRGAMGSLWCLPPLPSSSSSSSPSTSGGSTPSSPSTPARTPSSPKPARVLVTPLWKRKSIARKSSSFRSPRSAIKRMSFISSQVENQVNQSESKEPGSINIIKSRVSLLPKNVRPGSTAQCKEQLACNPYHPTQSANITSQSGREIYPITGQDGAHGE
jgi:hypothetical protein